MPSIAEAYLDVAARIAAAARQAGREPDEIALLAVTKTRPVEDVEAVIAAGARDLGENYVQELHAKWQELSARGHTDLRWHAIGHLQRNKVKQVAAYCSLIHSVDSAALGDEISRRADEHGRRQAVLIEVNIAGEDSKFGVGAEEAARLSERVASLPGVDLRGLMAMTPAGASPDECRELFSRTRELSVELARSLPRGSMGVLSMGMSQDYEAAVQEGSTLVRVGTAIFGRRV